MTQCRRCGFPDDMNDGQSDNVAGDPRGQLDELNSQISQVEALLRHLNGRAVLLGRRINQHCSPILQLPLDVTTEIFRACLPNLTSSARNSSSSMKVANAGMPLAIGKICSAWRELAWSTPTLWSGISLHLDNFSLTDYEIFQGWLLRSGSSPLSIRLTLHGDELCGDYTVAQKVMSTVVNSCERWRNVHFEIPESFYQFFEPIRSRLHLLFIVSLDLVDSYPSCSPFNYFSLAPQLRHIEIDGYDESLVELPLDLVTKLSLSPVTSSHCLEILRRCPGISHCTFRYMIWDLPPQKLPALVSQIIFCELSTHNGPTVLAFFLDRLILPALQELRINMFWDELPRLELVPFISRSLRRLALLKCRFTGAELKLVIEAIPSLVELELEYCDISNNEIFQLLETTAFLNLRVLKLLGLTDSDFLGLAKLLLSRWRSGSFVDKISVARLAVAALQPKDHFLARDEDTLAQLRHFIIDGMEISIQVHNPYA